MSEFTRFQNALAENGRLRNDGSDAIVVLHVDDEPDLADLTAEFLEREHDDFDIRTETDADAAIERVDDELDCVVSDYDMPGINGLEFLEAVREEYPDLPFILFTGKGSEEIASEAISAGVTDYLQKEAGTGQYPVLANRIVNAVEQYRATQAVERARKRFSKLIENSTDVISIVSSDARFQYLSPSAKRMFGYEPEEMVGEYIFDYAHPDDRQEAMERFFEAVEDPERRPVVQFRFKHKDGSWPVLQSRGRNLLDDPDIEGFVVNSRDITELKDHERELERQNEQLEEITSVISHDLRNPLSVAEGSLELARETGDDEYLGRVERSLARMDEIIDDMLVLARQGQNGVETGPVSLESVAESAWEMVDTDDADLRVETAEPIVADESRTQQLLENLLSNAVEHGGEGVTVEVGPIEDTSASEATEAGGCSATESLRGFYVQDDGVGISADEPETVFESGYSSTEIGTGFGLAIVRQIVKSHGWDVSVTAGPDGGTRFEIVGVESA